MMRLIVALCLFGFTHLVFAACDTTYPDLPKNPYKTFLQHAYACQGLTVEFPQDNDFTNEKDPFETFNRHAFQFNDRLDKAILKPIAKTYVFILPKFAQKGVHNFYTNVRMIPTFINDVLQGELIQAASDGWRFAVNSTAGIGGFLDVAADIDLPPHANDFGLTLAKWGYKNSSYFVIPFWGPSTIRDGVGLIPYYFMTVYPYIHDPKLYWGLLAFDIIDMRAQFLDLENIQKEAALDPYAFQRDAYLQRRNFLISGSTETKDIAQEEFGDEEWWDEDEDKSTQSTSDASKKENVKTEKKDKDDLTTTEA